VHPALRGDEIDDPLDAVAGLQVGEDIRSSRIRPALRSMT
jgi:hypothetical protein